VRFENTLHCTNCLENSPEKRSFKKSSMISVC